MGFRYEPGTLTAADAKLDQLQEWVGEARTYAAEHVAVAFGDEGVLNVLAQTHSSIEDTTDDYLRDLRDLLGDIGDAFTVTDRTYRQVDRDRARVLDSTMEALSPGRLGLADSLTAEPPDQYGSVTSWRDPSVELRHPEVDPDIGGPSWWDLLSPTALVNDAVLAVTGFAATIGLIDHQVNVMEEICKPIAGDWNAFARAGNALSNIGLFVHGARACVRDLADDLEAPWSGNASDGARLYLYDLAYSLDQSSDAFSSAAENYRNAAEAAKTFAGVVKSVIEAFTDAAVAASISVAATGAASASGFGLPIALLTGAYALSKVKKVVDGIFELFQALEKFKTAVDGTKTVLGGLGVVSGHLPLEPLNSTPVPSVTP